MEEFRDIAGYEGKYQVSNLGRVKSLSRLANNGRKVKEKIKKPALDRYGYLRVNLCKDNKTKTFKVHKLVAMVFLNHKPCGMKEVVDHINGIKTDNRLDNLQLITNRENSSKDRKGGTSKYVGVCWDKHRYKWRSNIYVKDKRVSLGRYNDEYEAHLKYQKALNNLDKYENPKQFRKYLELC